VPLGRLSRNLHPLLGDLAPAFFIPEMVRQLSLSATITGVVLKFVCPGTQA
jgi:hypothetical protein